MKVRVVDGAYSLDEDPQLERQPLPASVSTREILDEAYDEDAAFLSQLPGMQKLNLDRRYRVSAVDPKNRNSPGNPAYNYTTKRIWLDPTWSPESLQQSKFHEHTHAMMDQARNPDYQMFDQALAEAYNQYIEGDPNKTMRRYRYSVEDGAVKEIDPYLRGSLEKEGIGNLTHLFQTETWPDHRMRGGMSAAQEYYAPKPYEIASNLLQYTRSNKGTHPMLHPDGVEAGVDALIEHMLGKRDRESTFFDEQPEVLANFMKQNPKFREAAIKLFQRYAANDGVKVENDRYIIPNEVA